MAKQYEVTQAVRIQNRLVAGLVRLGIVPRWHVIGVEGRVSGKLRETPIDPIEIEGNRYLVAPYGSGNWVLNARKSGRVRLQSGRKIEYLQVAELSASESAPVLRAYLARGYVEDYFDASADSPLSEFEAEADRHPVFRVVGETAPFDS